MTHSILAASFAPVWARCSAAPLMAMQAPAQETQDTREGTCSHWVAATVLRSYQTQDTLLNCRMLVGSFDPDNTIVTEEIAEGAQVLVDDVLQFCNANGGLSSLWVEEKVAATSIHSECFGTMDGAWIGQTRIVVWDYKFGHREVSPIWNEQLLVYMAGIMDATRAHDQNLTVEFRIVQPRCYTGDGPVRSFQFPATDARAHINKLRMAAEEALSERATTTPGPHCKDCPAVHRCPAVRQLVGYAADYQHSPVPDTLTPEGMSFELAMLRDLLPVLTRRLEAIETEALQRAEFIPGFTVDRGKLGQRKFNVPFEQATEYGKLIGVDFTQSDKLVTPSEAERRLKAAGLTPDLLDGMTVRPELGPRLVPAKDSRAVRVFSHTSAPAGAATGVPQ